MSEEKNYWERLSEKITDPLDAKNKRPDTSTIEIDFYLKYLKTHYQLLDIGSGTGIITNKIIPHVKNTIAVEKFEGFSKFIVEAENVLVINADLIDFKIRKKFDAILCTGVGQCFKREDMSKIYQNMFDMLKKGSILISRMHCGLNEDIIVDGYSEELKTDYFAEFRHITKEIDLLKNIGFSSVETFDILPDSINVWDNSRHFIFICKK